MQLSRNDEEKREAKVDPHMSVAFLAMEPDGHRLKVGSAMLSRGKEKLTYRTKKNENNFDDEINGIVSHWSSNARRSTTENTRGKTIQSIRLHHVKGHARARGKERRRRTGLSKDARLHHECLFFPLHSVFAHFPSSNDSLVKLQVHNTQCVIFLMKIRAQKRDAAPLQFEAVTVHQILLPFEKQKIDTLVDHFYQCFGQT